MIGTLFDANVLLDIATADANWLAWSTHQVREAVARGPLVVNPIIYAEIAPAFVRPEELEAWIESKRLRREPLPYEAAWPAAQAFRDYRSNGGLRLTPMPDFYIGAHAAVAGLTLVTRDASRFRSYFPAVRIIAP